MVNHIYVGLDVHARTIAACGLDPETGQLYEHGFGPNPEPIIEWCLRLPGPVSVVYEAGPTGFGLARSFIQAGIDIIVAAPSKLPITPGDKVKTDKRDARKLAHWLAGGLATPVWIPDEQTETARDLFRCREDLQLVCKAAQQRLDNYLLRHGHHWTKTLWTIQHFNWLSHLRLQDGQDVFDEYLALVIDSRARLARLDKQISRLAETPRWAGVTRALECLRGISTLSAFGLAVEIGDWTRLDQTTIGSYLGLVPSEHSSGGSRQQGGITKTGNIHARRLLIEAAWCHERLLRAHSPKLARAYAKVPAPIASRAEQANRRLYHQWQHFKTHHTRGVVAATAIARELASFCYDLAIMTT